MNIFTAIILGIIQGLTEFVPISSSGHLVLFHRIFGIDEPTLFFDTMLHVGTLVAVVTVLHKDIGNILRKLIQPLMLHLIIATVPLVIAALIFRKQLELAFASSQFLGFSFLLTSALLLTAELLVRHAARNSENNAAAGQTTMTWNAITWRDALLICVMQAIAAIPGVSRSGATLSGALSRGLDRDFAARFVFLLSIPAILGAAVLQLAELAGGAAAGGIGLAPVIAGTASAAITGFFAVRFMLKIIREKSLWGFAVYTGLLGILVVLDQLALHLVF